MSDSTKQIAASQNIPMTSDTLNRSMSVWHSFTLGFAVVSPVAGQPDGGLLDETVFCVAH